MSAWRTLAVFLAAPALAACHVGPQVDKSDLGVSAYGANVDVELSRKAGAKRVEHNGELLEVRDDGLLILTHEEADIDPRIALIPWSTIHRAGTSDLPGIAVRMSQGDSQRKASTDKLRNVSRYPQGLSPELTGRLLARYGQSKPDTLE